MLSFKKILKRLLFFFQGLSFYRSLARTIFKENFKYEILDSDDPKIREFFNIGKKEVQEDVPKSKSEFENYTFAALKDNKIIGLCGLTNHGQKNPEYKGWWIWGLLVKFRYRGFGIGEKLTENIISFSKKKELKKIHLQVYEDNLKAKNLYLKFGFKTFKTKPGRNGRKLLLMEKRI